ncbi:MAG TPA: prohibitin family protein [Candidatus Limousia pullorum]|uniref:Prohibitin family protein n=1 Tax=Candidatus Limousia pullorum TaxID=2840860 RepID=A0A9D1LX91_9FIRM|nr:prohibitin family protein [Candidatus Limousia pullorum]
MEGFNPVNKVNSKVKKIIPIVAVIIVIAIIASFSIVIVPAGSTGVVMTLGKVSDNVMQEGLHFKVPFVQNVAIISNKIQKQEVQANAVSKDLQTVESEIAVNYRVGLDASANIYKNIGERYEEIVLLPAVQESMKSVSAKYTAEELITLRAQVGEEIKASLEEKVSEYGIVIEKFSIVNFDFSEEFNEAIEAKQVAEQNLIKTKTEQEQAIVIAEAEAQKKLIAAQAEADAITAKAQAQADANKLLAESLNDNVVEYEKIQKWDGKLPTVTGSDALISFDPNQNEEE